MATSVTRDYGSRKFIITMVGMWMCFIIGAVSMYLKVDVNAAVLLGIGSGIGAYNWANVRHNNGANNEN